MVFPFALPDPWPSSKTLLPLMDWEKQAMDILDLHKDQLRFTVALVASVFVGMGLQALRDPTVRHLYSLVTGVGLLYYVWGLACLHALVPAIATYVGMVAVPKHSGVLAWLINFPYLLYMHAASPQHYDARAGALDFTGCQMVLFLKLISMAVCYQDFRTKKKEDMNEFQAAHALHSLPSPLALGSYVFGFGNLLAGPYIEFTVYDNFINFRGVWDAKAKRKAPSVVGPGVLTMAKALFFMGCFKYMMPRFNMGVLFTPWYMGLPFLQKNFVQFLCGLTSQFKYCFAWTLSEASATFAGLNFEKWDETTGKAVWGRCSNIHFFMLLTSDSPKMVPVHWNMCTGIFLRRYVYERLAPKGKRPGFPQLLATQLTSALWHGFSAGIWLFFVGTAFSFHFGGVIYNLEQGYLPKALVSSLPWKLLKIVWNQYQINYLVLSFHINDNPKAIQAWRTTYFWGHFVMLFGCLLGAFLPKKRSSKGQGKGQGAGAASEGATGKEGSGHKKNQ